MKLIKTPRLETLQITQLLIKNLSVKVSRTSVKEAIQNHPDSLTILAVNDSLLEWGLDSCVYHVDKTDFENQEMYYPFVAQIPEQGGHFLLVYKIENDTVFFSGDEKKNGTMPLPDFLKRWSGVALHAKAANAKGEANYTQNRTKETLRSLLLPGMLFLLLTLSLKYINASPFGWEAILLLSLKLGGISLSVALLMQGLNANNPFIKNLCTLGGKNDCNAILKSDAAKVTAWLSWSEVGFFYFSGSLLWMFLVPSALFVPAWLNIFALPYTLYSISYQYRHKNWCVLCCSVQAILVLEAITFCLVQEYAIPVAQINASLAMLFAFAFLLPIVIWGFLKPFFKEAAQLKPAKNQLKKFKYDETLFQQALKNQAKYAVSDELMPIVLGNPEAETVITMVSNPFCGPCAQAHKALNEWLKYRDDIQLKVIFVTLGKDDQQAKIAQHFIALKEKGSAALLEDAMDDWYQSGKKDYEIWASKHPVKMLENSMQIVQGQKAWCDMAEITKTPTFLVNGYKLPDPYYLEDIKYFI